MFLAFNVEKQGRNKLFVCEDAFPQTLEVVGTRAAPIGVELVTDAAGPEPPADAFAGFIQYPAASGAVRTLRIRPPVRGAGHGRHRRHRPAEPVPPHASGEVGADIVVGSAQRFGVPMGFGGLTPAFSPPGTGTSA